MVLSLSAFIEWFIGIIQLYGPVSVFVGIIIEEVIVPIPSPIIPMAAGFILIPAGISVFDASLKIFFTIAIPGAIATGIGSLVIYAVAYYGGEAVVKRFQRFFGVTIDDIKKMSKKLGKGKKLWATIVVLRAIPIFPTSAVTIAAGVLRLDIKKFFISTVIGAIPRIFILGFVGWHLGSAYLSIAETIDKAEGVILALIFVAVVAGIYLYIKRTKRKSTKKQ